MKLSTLPLLALAVVVPALAETAPEKSAAEPARNIVKTMDFTQEEPLFAQVVKSEDKAKAEESTDNGINIVKVIDFTREDPFAAVDFSGKAVDPVAAKAAAERQESAVSSSRAIAKSVTYTVRGKTYRTLSSAENFAEEGRASWYGPGFHGRKTASGEVFNQNALTAAHKELPLGTQVKVTNLVNGRSVVVRINDRGPFHGDRIIDLSKAAAQELGVVAAGTARVSVVAYK